MKNRRIRFGKIMLTICEIAGIIVIIFGIVCFFAFEKPLSERLIGITGIIFGGVFAFYISFTAKKEMKEIEDIRVYAKESVERAFNVANPREIFFHSPPHYCNEATMLYTIISNSNIKFYATINDDKSITVTAIDGEKKIYQENISNYVYFSNLFYFRKSDADG